METDTVLHIALFSGILGFLAFCASYAAHVWRSRNAASRRSAETDARARLLRWSLLSLGLGGALLVVSLIWREVSPREGVLSGEGLYTVRASDNLQVECVTSARTVCTGDSLARFRSPERRAELIELELKRQILQSQLKAVELQPLTTDGELVREYERAVADQRQLLASLTYLVPEHAVVVREKLRDRLDKTERINALATRIDTARHELEQATARLELARKHHTRVENLSEAGAAAELERDERSTASTVEEAEVARLQAAIAGMEVERKHLQESLPAFAACTSQQAEDIRQQVSNVRDQLSSTETQAEANRQRLEQDRERARQLRSQMLAQLDLEIRQCQAKLESVQDVLVIKAPFDGVVAYADAAPGMALPRAPVVVLAPKQGFRLRLRLTEAELEPLSRRESVPLALVAPILQRRFSGRLVKWDKLPEEPGYTIAELACLPPPETIRELAARDWGTGDWLDKPTVSVRLLWRPPVSASPLFYPAIAMMAVGLVGLLAVKLRRQQPADRAGKPAAVASTRTHAQTHATLPLDLCAPASEPSPSFGALDLEAGALGRNLQMLGNRFRESIRRRQIEPTLLSALEWAIDRHHTRAIEHLSLGLDHDPELAGSLKELFSPAESRADGGTRQTQEATAHRVMRIVQALAPDLLEDATEETLSRAPAGRTDSRCVPRHREIDVVSR